MPQGKGTYGSKVGRPKGDGDSPASSKDKTKLKARPKLGPGGYGAEVKKREQLKIAKKVLKSLDARNRSKKTY